MSIHIVPLFLVSDMYADAVLCAVLQAESMDTPSYVPTSASSMKVDKMHFKVMLIFIPWKSKCDLNRLNRQIPSFSKFLVSSVVIIQF